MVKRWDIEDRCGWMQNAADRMEVDDYQGSYVHATDYDALARELTAYQIAKDNLELRLRDALGIGLEGGPRRIPDGMTLLHGTKQVY